MTRHVLKLVWNRKRASALIIVEIFLSFLVVFAVITGAATILMNWNRPLGYDWHDVWNVRLEVPNDLPDRSEDAERLAIARVLRELESFPEVSAVAASATPPYAMSTIEGVWHVNGRVVRITRDEVTDRYADVMRIKTIRGRWFEPADDAANFVPVVIDTELAEDLYPGVDPIGKKFDESDNVELRVVGLIPPFRKQGEMNPKDTNMAFTRVSVNKPANRVPYNLVIRLRPGTPAAFEETLSARLHEVVPEMTFRIRHMDRMREFSLRIYTAPLIIGGIVAAFLIAMVMLGLSGVLWQNVTRRTRELGLRRALGAAGHEVRRQILGEVAMLVTLAVIVGVLVVGQLPILGIFRIVTPAAFAVGIAASLAMIYGIALLCGAYPGWLASRVQPAQALHYE